MNEIKVLKSIEVLLGNYGSVRIEEALDGGYKILIDTQSENIWLGFKEPRITHYVYWKSVQHWHQEQRVIKEAGAEA